MVKLYGPKWMKTSPVAAHTIKSPFCPLSHKPSVWDQTFSIGAENYWKYKNKNILVELIPPPTPPSSSHCDHFYADLQARTGYPFVDAIMTQLRREGWIHHLARHAVACFLTRGDLWVSWEEGLKVKQTFSTATFIKVEMKTALLSIGFPFGRLSIWFQKTSWNRHGPPLQQQQQPLFSSWLIRKIIIVTFL